VIVVAVRWYLRYGLSYRVVEELLAERGIEVDHVTAYRWVQRFTPLLADTARFCTHAPGDRWLVNETYVKVGCVWRNVYRAIDQYGQVIDLLVSPRRDAAAVRRFFTRALQMLKVTLSEVVTDAAAVYAGVLDEQAGGVAGEVAPRACGVGRHPHDRLIRARALPSRRSGLLAQRVRVTVSKPAGYQLS
jgi:transposase-like protein